MHWVPNEALQGSPCLYFRDFEAQFPSVELSESFKKQVICACEVMTYVLQGKAITGDKVRKTFIKTGKHVEDHPSFSMPGFGHTTIDIRRMLGQCSSQFACPCAIYFSTSLSSECNKPIIIPRETSYVINLSIKRAKQSWIGQLQLPGSRKKTRQWERTV